MPFSTTNLTVEKILRLLARRGSRRTIAGMKRYGIVTPRAFGVSAPDVRALAKRIGVNHGLALKLWETGFLEARTLAALIADPRLVTGRLMEAWVREFDNWAVCDAVCGEVFDKTRMAEKKAVAWTRRTHEFTKRAGFVLMASMAVHRKELPDQVFTSFLRVIQASGDDDRNFVKKAVNWALRQIGKRNVRLNQEAVTVASRLRDQGTPAARWIASDALRELGNPAILARLKTKELRAASALQMKQQNRKRRQ